MPQGTVLRVYVDRPANQPYTITRSQLFSSFLSWKPNIFRTNKYIFGPRIAVGFGNTSRLAGQVAKTHQCENVFDITMIFSIGLLKILP